MNSEPEGVTALSELEDDAIAVEGVQMEKAAQVVDKEVPKTYRIREFFVKWQGKSYWKNSWVSEIRVSLVYPLSLLMIGPYYVLCGL